MNQGKPSANNELRATLPEIRQGMALQLSDFLVLKAGSSPETSTA